MTYCYASNIILAHFFALQYSFIWWSAGIPHSPSARTQPFTLLRCRCACHSMADEQLSYLRCKTFGRQPNQGFMTLENFRVGFPWHAMGMIFDTCDHPASEDMPVGGYPVLSCSKGYLVLNNAVQC